MDNGCPECKKLPLYRRYKRDGSMNLCLTCQLEQAEATVLQAMNRVEEVKQKIKEKQC